MDIYIPIDQMPKTPRECDCFDGTHCLKDNPCDDVCLLQVGQDCTRLKPIEQWRLESCVTCAFNETDYSYPLSGCPNEFYDSIVSSFPFHLHKKTTCSNWKGKDGTKI